jgi:hypothetical protein
MKGWKLLGRRMHSRREWEPRLPVQTLLGAALISMALAAEPAHAVRLSATAVQAQLEAAAVSPEAQQMVRLALEGGDAQGRPFAVVDKKEARLLVFRADGRLAGAAPALLGLARGDTLDPNVGQMVNTGIPPALRTTPSGRYDSQPGPNLKGETVIWVDYDAAFAIHRLRPAPASERRAERLASPSPDDNRISLGCVIVTGEFFDHVVRPVLGAGPGVVYVLPEPLPPAEPPVALNADPASGDRPVQGARPVLRQDTGRL